MKKLFVFLISFVIALCNVNSQVLIDNFLEGYSIGNELEKGEYSGTSGVTIMPNQWNLSGNSGGKAGTNPSIVANLTYPGYPQNEPAIELNKSNGRISIYSLTDNSSTYSGVYYLSFLINMTEVTSTQDILAFDANFTGNTARGKLFVGTSGGKLQFRTSIASAASGATIATGTYDLNTTHLVVMKINHIAQTMSLFINPVISGQEPTPQAESPEEDSNNLNIKGIQIKQRTSHAGSIGGFRFADNWADAVGYDPTSNIINETISREWDFTNWSAETLQNLETDALWSKESDSQYRKSGISGDSGELIASSVSIPETADLIFKCIGGTNIQIHHSTNSSCLRSGNKSLQIVVPNVNKGQVIRVISQSASTSEARSINANNSISRCGGYESVNKIINDFEAIETGNITISCSSGVSYYSIQVIDITTEELTAGNLAGKTDIKLDKINADDISLINSVNLTTLDLTWISDIPTDLAPANDNCLIYVDENSTLNGDFNLVKGTVASSIVLTDKLPFHNIRQFTAEQISYSRTFPNQGWASLCLPFVPATIPTGIELEQFTEAQGSVVKFEQIEDIAANTPYIANIKGELIKEFSTMNALIPVTEIKNIKIGDYIFKGTFTGIVSPLANGLYMLKTDGSGFGKGTSDASIVPFRAYIEEVEDGGSGGSTKQLTIIHDGGATGLSTNSVEQNLSFWSANGVLNIYSSTGQTVRLITLDGRIAATLLLQQGENSLDGLSKGIYLINNQKVVVK